MNENVDKTFFVLSELLSLQTKNYSSARNIQIVFLF